MISNNIIEINFPKGIVTLVGARPAMGKSAFAISMAINLAKRNQKFIYFSLEMDKEQVIERIKQQTDEKGYGTIKERIIIDDTPGLKISHVRKLLENVPTDYIFIDYLQLMTSDCKQESPKAELQSFIWALKELAEEFNVAIIVLSQVNRGGSHCPDKSDISVLSADDLEGIHITFLHREWYYHRIFKRYCNGYLISGKTMFVSYKEALPHVTYLYFDAQTTKMSMWYSWPRFKKEIANSNMLIHFDENEINAFEKSDDSNMTFIEASISKTSKNRSQELANMLFSQIPEVLLCKSQNMDVLILVQIPLDAGFTYKELENIKEFIRTNFPADAIISKVQMGVAEREDDNIKIICAFNCIG